MFTVQEGPLARGHKRRTAVVAIVVGLLVGTSALGNAAVVSRSVLSGAVQTGERPLPGSVVVLYAAGSTSPRRLGSAITGARGEFRITYLRPRAAAVLYLVATGGSRAAGAAVQLLSVAGSARRPLRSVKVNELTTVASAFALAQFTHGAVVRGRSPGLENAAATASNLMNPATGGVSSVLATPPNGGDTDSLATLRTLADIVGGCTQGSPRTCRRLFVAATLPGAALPANTLQAVLDVAHNPTHSSARLFALRKTHSYDPQLSAAPTAWVLSLKYTVGGFNGPGRMAFDSHGNVWVTNNFEPPAPNTSAGFGLISLSPTGKPINNSPVEGGGLEGVWWGIAIDQRDQVWTSNYTGHDTTPFTSPDFKGGTSVSEFADNGSPLSPSTGFTNGNISAPQGLAVDQHRNVWIANHVGNSVTEYPRGDPSAAKVITGGGLSKPFAIAIDARGNKWVTDNAISNTLPGGVTKIDASGRASGPIMGGGLSSPQGISVDRYGNLWVANLGSDSITLIGPDGRINPRSPIRAKSLIGPWSTAVDGNGNIWVASFIGQTLTELCGANRSRCPPGTRTGGVLSPRARGFTNGGLEHLTAVQIDASGNVWVANNWKRIAPTVGGDGLVEFIGLAAPVKTPLIGPPQRP
jgi:streptogramin lyase